MAKGVSMTLPKDVSFQGGEAVDVVIDKLTSDPSPLKEGQIWIRTDLDRLCYTPDGTTVYRVPLSSTGINIDSHKGRHAAGGADALTDADIDGIVGFDLGAHVGRHKSGGTDPLAKADIESLLGIGTLIEGIVSIDCPSIPAGSCVNVNVTVTGLTASHSVIVMCQDDLEAGVIVQAAYVPSANTLRVRFYNPTAAAIDPFLAMYTYWAWI